MWWSSEKVSSIHKMASPKMMIYIPILFIIIISSYGPALVRGKYLEECERSSTTGQDYSLNCRLRTINSEFDKTNFSAISGDSVVSLQLQCSDVLFYQSSLQPGSLAHFSRLASLHIEHCKLSRLPPSVFAGLSLLKNLTIRTHNTAWPVLSLDIASGVFTHLPHLEKVDISANNIWTFPDRLFCPASSLETLNVSLNRLQDISDLGFRDRDDKEANGGGGPMSGGGPGSGREPGCKLGIQILDLSYNRLILLPPRGLGTLSSLRELYLQGNEISVVADRALAGLKGLRVLNLADNKVVALPESLLADSTEITEIYLQNNSLSSLPPKLLAKLNQLVVLDLSHNILTSNWMMKSKLQRTPSTNNSTSNNNNSTTSKPTTVSSTTATATAATTTTTLSAVSPKSEGAGGIFSGLIRLVLLNLGYNRLTRLSPEPFQDLYSLQILNVEHNSIDTIEPNTFSAMNNLHTLILSHNKLTFIDATALNGLFVLSLLSLDNNALAGVHPSAFHNCSSLKDLNLNGNSFATIPLAIQNLTLLKTVDLGENQIEQLESPRLIGLPNLYGLRVTGNRVANVSKEDLKELPSLKVLNLARNRLQYVEKGSFDLNTNLQAVRLDSNFLTDISNLFAESPALIWLNVSDNHLTWFDYALIPKQLQWLDIHKNGIADLGNYFQSTFDDLRLQTLDASFNRLTKIGPSNIPNSLEMLYLNDNLISTVEPHTFYKKVNLSRVDIFANQIETMDFKAMQLAPYPEGKPLPEFYIGGNPIVCDCNMEWLQRLNKLDHLRQHPKVMDLDSVYCKLVYNRESYYVPLAEAKASQFLCTYKTHCFALCHCCEFDACDCEMTCPNNCTCYHDDTWSANIVDCAGQGHTNVPSRIPMDSTEVYLDGNNFEELTSHVFIGRKNMRVLYLNNSRIETLQNNTFSGLKRLQVLHLENNYLSSLSGYEFEPLEDLHELYLQSNQISFIANNTFASLRVLEVLKLDGNRLSRFTMWSLSFNPYLVEIALNNNPWSCDCDYVSAAAPWIQANVAKLMDASGVNCRLNGKSLSLVQMNGTKCSEIIALSGAVEAPETVLPPYLPLLLVLSALILLIGTIFIAVCRKRNSSLRIWAAAKCPPLINHCYRTALHDNDDREKLYDAYVAYSVKDESWVSQVFANELQSSCDNTYRLCLHYKDFPVTSYIADTIVEAVESSRRTVIVLSKNFIQSEWCRFEFKSALHAALRGKKNGRLVAVTLGDLPTRDLDPDLRVCLRSATVLSANDKLFWAKLRCALPNPRASSSSFNTASNSNSSRTLTRPGSGSNNSVSSSVSNTYNCSTGGGSTLPLNVSASVGVVGGVLPTTNNSHHQYHHSNTLLSNNGNNSVNNSSHLHHHHQTLLHHHQQLQQQSLQQQQQQQQAQYEYQSIGSGSITGGTLPHHLHHHNNSGVGVSVPLFVPPFPPPNRPPPPFPAPRRPPPPTPLWA